MNKPSKLLIIDDNKETSPYLKIFSLRKSMRFSPLPTALEGLKILETEQQGFDLVITDLVMPNISGVALISIIKKRFPDTL